MVKKLFALIMSLFMVLTLVACNNETPPDPNPNLPGGNENQQTTDADLFKGLDFNMSASLDVMVWSGDGKYYEDIGHQTLEPANITGQNVAALYAVAKEFNKLFPNVKINLYSKANDPDGGGVTWAEELKAFNEEHQKYPDVWASNNVARDITNGLALDLKEFSETVYYKRMNESLLNLTNYYGFQGGLPQYILPWGVYVNRELAENNNIKTPDPDWSWAQYTNFVAAAKPANGVYGSWDSGMQLVRWATVEEQIQNDSVENGYIDINTTVFKNAIKMLPKQATTSVQSLYGLGELTADDMVEIGNWWGYQAFADGDLLTYYGDPWMLGTSNIEGTTNYVTSGDWDIYPAPSIDGENFVSAVLDPVCVYNYYGKNSNPTENQRKKALLAYSFAAFWTSDTRSWQARVDQQYNSGNGVLASSLNDSFPITTGDYFKEQMQLWYATPGHAAYKDTEKFPGFAYVCELWDEGHIRAASDKAYPLSYIDSTGTTIDCLAYLTQFGNPDYVGNVTLSDGDTWVNTYIAGIEEWNTKMNGYFNEAFLLVRNALKEYYGYSDSDFK